MRKNFEKKKRQYNPVQKEQYSGIQECKFCGRKHEMVKSNQTCNLCKRSVVIILLLNAQERIRK
jgi:ribosomal protein S14